MGRPTKYSKATIAKSQEYLDSCIDTREIVEYGKSGQIIWNVEIPSHAGLAVHLGVGRRTIYDWSKDHPAFSHMLDKIMVEQEKRLVNNGLGGNYNSTITKLMLAKHGYVDESKSDNKHTLSGFSDLLKSSRDNEK